MHACLLEVKRGVTLVPSAAVQRGAKGHFRVCGQSGPDGGVRSVTVGVTHGDDASINSGLVPDELVVVDGTEKLREGSKVEIRNSDDKAAARGRHRRQPSRTTPRKRKAIVNPVPPLHHAAGGDRADDGRHFAWPASSRTDSWPVSALPQIDYPTIQVLTFYPGASPDVMASSVTAPLERQFGQMPGLNQMTSTSSGGSSVVTLAVHVWT